MERAFPLTRWVFHRNYLTQTYRFFFFSILFMLFWGTWIHWFSLTYASVFQIVLYRNECLISPFDSLHGKAGDWVKTIPSFNYSPVPSSIYLFKYLFIEWRQLYLKSTTCQECRQAQHHDTMIQITLHSTCMTLLRSSSYTWQTLWSLEC